MTEIVVVLQARTGSSRLPAKVLLPIRGLPLVVLAAKRASNTGKKVIVATSSEPEDDELASVLSSYELECYRGSLKNVLERMIGATVSYKEEAIFVRLTADNAFPDGRIIEEMVEYFIGGNLDYLCCNGVDAGVPYGLSVEITTVKNLREAASRVDLTKYDLEHVTPSIIKKFGKTFFCEYAFLEAGDYRATIDTYSDYLNVCKVFSFATDPVLISGIELVEILKKIGTPRL